MIREINFDKAIIYQFWDTYNKDEKTVYMSPSWYSVSFECHNQCFGSEYKTSPFSVNIDTKFKTLEEAREYVKACGFDGELIEDTL